MKQMRAAHLWLALGLLVAGCGATVAGADKTSGPQAEPHASRAHVEQLGDPTKRQQAVEQLLQLYADAMTADKGDRRGPHVKPLLEHIVAPLSQAFVAGQLEGETKGDVIALLADTHDERANPAILKAFTEYRTGDRAVELYDIRIVKVVSAIGEAAREGTVDKEISAALLEIFVQLEASTQLALNRGFYRVLNNTLIQIADPAWEARLLPLLDKPIESTKQKFMKDVMNQAYWQITAAEILGVLKSDKAVEPLCRIMLSPNKAPLQTTAVNALISIGKPAVEVAARLLNGQSPELMSYSTKEYIRSKEDQGVAIDGAVTAQARSFHLATAVILLANIGRAEAEKPLLSALSRPDPVLKALIARELYKLPQSDRIIETFKKIYTQTTMSTKIPPGNYAKEQLAESAGSFFDQKLTGWLIADALALKGEPADVAAVQMTVLGVVLKTATADQWASVEKLSATVFANVPKAPERAAYKKAMGHAKTALDRCGSDVDCYLKIMRSPEGSQKETQMLGLKAAHMTGVLGKGDSGLKSKLIEALPAVDNGAVRFVIGLIIDHCSPRGDAGLAKTLQAMVDEAELSGQNEQRSRVKPLKQIIYRLRARGE